MVDAARGALVVETVTSQFGRGEPVSYGKEDAFVRAKAGGERVAGAERVAELSDGPRDQPSAELARRASDASPDTVLHALSLRCSEEESGSDDEHPVPHDDEPGFGEGLLEEECYPEFQQPPALAPVAQTAGEYIDALLREQVSSFHALGPLINPLPKETQSAETLKFACDAKGFDYAICWQIRPDGTLTFHHGHMLPRGADAYMGRGDGFGMDVEAAAQRRRALELYYRSSRTFYSFSVGLGIPGRVAYTGQHAWMPMVQSMQKCEFHRRDLATQANINTVVCVPVNGGVVELGSSNVMYENPETLNYLRTMLCTAGDLFGAELQESRVDSAADVMSDKASSWNTI